MDCKHIVLHRYGKPCYVETDKISYVGPLAGSNAVYIIVDSVPLILDESPKEVMAALSKEG